MAITRWFAEVQRIVRPRAEFDGSGDGMADQHPELPLNDATVLSQRPPGSDLPPPALLVGVRELGANLEGTTLGHFHLEKFVGGGGMGAVFRGVDTKLGRIVAVKVLPATATSFDAAAQDTVRRFQNEAQSAARLDHPNIARVYYVGEQESLNYIVFEYIDGENLRDLVANQGPLSLADVIDFTTQLAQALDHAAQRGVVHRDIKPSNVLVTADQRIKLVDMGLARLHQIEAPQGDLTATGVTLGTFDYVSPEQARDPRSADVRSDLYSLGCTLFYMLTGRPPFPDGTVLQKLLSHSSDPPPDVRTFRPDLPAEVNALV
ncbi:MAG: serine/threonine-protein kinase, partial [Planctomycetota bacterium]